MNAAILGAVRSAAMRGIEVIGIENGYRGLLDASYRWPPRRHSSNDWLCLADVVEDVAGAGGTVLGWS